MLTVVSFAQLDILEIFADLHFFGEIESCGERS
jgi:hypothetical protein